MDIIKLPIPSHTHTISIVPVPGIDVLGASVEVDNTPTALSSRPNSTTGIVALHATTFPTDAKLCVAFMSVPNAGDLRASTTLVTTCERSADAPIDIQTEIPLQTTSRFLAGRNGFGEADWHHERDTFATELRIANDGFYPADIHINISLPPATWADAPLFRRKATNDAVVLTASKTIGTTEEAVFPLQIHAIDPSAAQFPLVAEVCIETPHGESTTQHYELLAQRTIAPSAHITIGKMDDQPRHNGESVPITLAIENGPTTLEACTLQLHGSDIEPITLAIGTLLPCEQRQISSILRILPTDGGRYDSTFHALLRDTAGFEATNSATFTIEAIPDLSLVATPQPTWENGVTPIHLTVVNDGDGTAHNVTITVAASDHLIVEALAEPTMGKTPAQPLPPGAGPFAQGYLIGSIPRAQRIATTMLLAPTTKPTLSLDFAVAATEFARPLHAHAEVLIRTSAPQQEYLQATTDAHDPLPIQSEEAVVEEATQPSITATGSVRDDEPAQTPDSTHDTLTGQDHARKPADDEANNVDRSKPAEAEPDLVFPRFSLQSDRLLECFAPSTDAIADDTEDPFEATWITAGHVGLALLAYLPTYDSRANDELTRLQTDLHRTLDALVPRMIEKAWGLTDDILFDLSFQTGAHAYLKAIGALPTTPPNADHEALLMRGLLQQIRCSDETAEASIAKIRDIYADALDLESPSWGLPLRADALGAIYDILYDARSIAA